MIKVRRLACLLVAIVACSADHPNHLADGGASDGAVDGAAPSDASPHGDAGSQRDASTGGDATSRADGQTGDAVAPADAPACTAAHCCVPADCQTGDAGVGAQFTCENHVCVDVAGSLSGLLWSLPCTGAHSSTSCTTDPTATASTTVGGHAGTTYDITVHLRGVIEQRTYASSCPDGSAVIGGAASGSDPFNIYELDISAPPQRLFVNPGTSSINNTFPIDYAVTFRADAGATVTLHAASIDAAEIFNHDVGGTPIAVAGTSVAQPFDGQFIEMAVDAVVPDPIDSGATVGVGSAGFAIQLAGAQQAAVADAASLEPADVTLEAWVQASATPGSYNTVINKVFGGGAEDSLALWFQSGQLGTGVNRDSPSGAASADFTPVDATWHHVAGTFDHATGLATLYIDGAPVACALEPVAIEYDAHPMLIGADVDNGSPNGFWDGFIDEVRVFSLARTPDQIWADMHAHQLGPTVGLVGEWTFDEGTGQTAADSSGRANPAVLGSTTAVEASDPAWVVSTVPH